MATDAERETLETMLNRNFLFSEEDKKLVRMGWMLRVQQEEDAKQTAAQKAAERWGLK